MDNIYPLLKGHLAQLQAQGINPSAKIGLLLFLPDAGVNALMQKAHLKEQRTIIDSTTEINSWFDDKISLHSVPGILHQKKELAKYTKSILTAYKKHHLDCINVCIDIHSASLMSPRGLVIELSKLKKHIEALCHKLENKPNLFITFTQLDKIAGFCHTFGDADLNTAWGYDFTPYINEASLIKQQNDKYKALIETLHFDLFEKLHITNDKLSRYLIREFPLQMESLSNMIRACIKNLSDESTVTKGVYFTSAKQGNHANDRLSKYITQAFALSPIDKIPQSTIDKAFFIQGWINTLQNTSTVSIKKAPSKTKNILLSGAVSLSVSTVLISLYVNHQTNLLNKANTHLQASKSAYQSQKNITESLKALKDAEIYALKASHILSFSDVKHFAKNTKAQYQYGLNHWLLPDFKYQIEKKLSEKNNPYQTYQALKAYLMLNDNLATDKDYLISWYEKNWQPNIAKEEKAKVKKLLADAFRAPYPGININQDLVKNTRAYLLALPKDYLLFSLAKNHLSDKSVTVSIPLFGYQNFAIPEIYQKEHFLSVYNKELELSARKLAVDDFVLGFKSEKDLSHYLKEAYVKNYVSFWKMFIGKGQAQSFDNFSSGKNFYLSLAKENNAFEKLLTLVQKEVSAFENNTNNSEKIFNQHIAKSFSELQLVTPYQLHLIRKEFANLAKYFQNFSDSTDSGKSAFNLAKKRFMHQNASDPFSRLYELSSELPPLAQPWLTSVNDNGWFLVLLKTESYINTLWNQRVYQRYHLQLKDKFPFNANSQTEVSLHDFSEFFASDGTLNQFFEETLSPFIDMSSAKWQMKTLNNLRLPISDESLKEIMRANVIKEIFFPNQSKQPDVRFSLHAISLEPIISALEIDINQQNLKESQQKKVAKEFSWPNDEGMAKTRLTLTKVSGEEVSIEEEGDWGFFRLLNQANFTPIEDDTQNYQLIFDINGNSAKFLLSAKSPLNPFVPQLLESFKLPHRLS